MSGIILETSITAFGIRFSYKRDSITYCSQVFAVSERFWRSLYRLLVIQCAECVGNSSLVNCGLEQVIRTCFLRMIFWPGMRNSVILGVKNNCCF